MKLRWTLVGLASALAGAFIYKKTHFYDPSTKDHLRKGLISIKRDDIQEAENQFHQALQSSLRSSGPNSVSI
jgi:hypothetical protein